MFHIYCKIGKYRSEDKNLIINTVGLFIFWGRASEVSKTLSRYTNAMVVYIYVRCLLCNCVPIGEDVAISIASSIFLILTRSLQAILEELIAHSP